MKYEWNSLKATGNIQKHGVEFSDAVIALEDELISFPNSTHTNKLSLMYHNYYFSKYQVELDNRHSQTGVWERAI